MSKILLVSGHGYSDVGAVGYGTNERDFIRKHITPNVAKHIKSLGGNVEIYNPNWDMFADTRAGYGMYRYKGQDVKIVELHLDSASASASGGHVIIRSGYKADNIDNKLVDVLKKYVGLRGGRGLDYRTDLLHLNVAHELKLNYRLVELGFITNTKDMTNIMSNLNEFTKDLANAILGNSNVKKNKTVKKSSLPKEWQVNKHGTIYKKERATFVSNTDIVARDNSPFRSAKSNGVFKKGQSVIYNEVALQDGHVWIGYLLNNGKYEWLPIRTWDGNRPPNHSVGKMWGHIK